MKLCRQQLHDMDDPANVTVLSSGRRNCRPCRFNYHRLRDEQARRSVLDVYGARCVQCGETDIDMLEIDHVDGGGQKCGAALIRWILANDFPPEPRLQVLCANHHAKKTRSETRARRLD